MIKDRIFLVHEWKTADGNHHLHIWSKDRIEPKTLYYHKEDWASALQKAYEIAAELNLDYFQVDHPDFNEFMRKVMRIEDVKGE